MTGSTRHWLAEQGMVEPELYEYLGGMSQDHWEYTIAHTILKRFMKPPKAVLEIGVYGGYTMMGWLLFGRPDIVVALDIKMQPTAPLPEYVIKVEGDSHSPSVVKKVLSLFPNGIDYLFIDGDHSLEGCLKDYNYFAPHVNEGGAIGFHDIQDGEVRATWRECVKRYPTIQLQNAAMDGSRLGLGLVFRLPQTGPFTEIRVD